MTHRFNSRFGFPAAVVLAWFFLVAPGQARAALYWVRLARSPSAKQARHLAGLVQSDWTTGGRLRRVMVHRAQETSTTGASAGETQTFFDVLLGPFGSLPRALNASYEFQRSQPWLSKGWALGKVPVVLSGTFVSAPVRFTEDLARACRDLRSPGRQGTGPTGPGQSGPGRVAPESAGPRGQAHGATARSSGDLHRTDGGTAGLHVNTTRPNESAHMPVQQKMVWPRLAEALTAKGFGYATPRAYVPPMEQSVGSFLAWDRLLVWGRREVCQKVPKVVGGPKPHFGPGPKDMTPQVHAGGRRCLEWLLALTPDMRLAWFPATQLALSHRFKKTTLASRWGPVRIRYSLVRVGRSPKGILYQAVVRSGGFPPLRKMIAMPAKYPPPHRLGFDRLGAALYEGRGLIVRRLTIQPPSPPVPGLWKQRSFKQYLHYRPESE